MHGEIGKISKATLQKNVASYTVNFIPEKDGGYSVIVPALPGCNTQGDTFSEAERNAREAILCYLESLIADDEPIPKETGVISKRIAVAE